MKKIPYTPIVGRLAATLAVAVSAIVAQATPYATSLTNTGSAIRFRLNEAADNVQILSGASLDVTNTLGPMTTGLKTTNLTITGVYKILVTKNGNNTIGQIGGLTNNSARGIAINNNPSSGNFGRVYMGNSANGTLGDGIYIYNADLSNPFGSSTNLRTAGFDWGTGGAFAPMRIFVATNDLVYAGDWSDPSGNLIGMDADVSSFWYVLQPLIGTAGMPATPLGSNNVHGSVYGAYVTGSTNTGDMKVYTMDEDYQLDPASVIANQMNSIWEYDIGSGPLPWTNPPTKLLLVPSIQFLSQHGDFTIGPSGLIYVNQRRANAAILPGGTYSPSLFVVDPNRYIDPTNYNGSGYYLTTNDTAPDSYFTNFYALYDPTNLPYAIIPGITNYLGTNLFTLTSNYNRHATSGGHIWDSQSASSDIRAGVADLFGEANGISVSPDGKFIACITFGALNGLNANQIKIARLTNGIPDLTKFWTFATGSTAQAGRALAWDSANNIYLIGSSAGTGATVPYTKVYSLNFASKALTGSDGTFELALPPNEVWVSLPDSLAAEGTPVTDTATITFYRSGDTSASLTVNYTIGGTATNTTDYTTIPTSVTFAPGAATMNVVITPVDDAAVEVPETVTLTITASTNYTSLYNKAATIVIADNETPQISIVPLFTNMYERVVNDFTRYQLVRRGDTNTASFSVNLDYIGVVNGTDFSGPSAVSFNPGNVTVNFELNPIDNGTVTGNRPFTVSIAAAGGGEYSISSTNMASGVIMDDDLPAETVIWSNDFDAYEGTNANTLPPDWTFTYGSTNTFTTNANDFDFTFGFNYGTLGVPFPPGSVTSVGLVATVNKHLTGISAGWAAALNFYPTNHAAFTNDYALRFNMLLTVPSATNQTEHAIFGINHSDAGDKTNWWSSSSTVLNGNNQDGLWFAVNNVGGNTMDFALFTRGATATAPLTLSNRPATTLAQTFKNPPYFGAGMPGISQATIPSPTWTWLDVEVAQTTNMIVLRLNNTVIIQTTNITAFKSGNIMLGYNDAFNSVGGGGGSVIYDSVRVVSITPPTLTTQPVSVVATNGTPAGFSVTATTGTGITNYQWFFNGNLIAGATTSALNFASVQSTNYGNYWVVVDDGRYPVRSATATLLPPAAGIGIITDPISRVVPFGRPTSFSGAAFTSSGVTNYQWMMGSPLTNVTGANYTGITSNTLSIASVRSTNAGPYRLRASDGFNFVTSSVANLTIATQPTITSALSGSTLNLTFPTEIGPKYIVEWKGALTNGAWNPLSTNDGTGGTITVPDSVLTDLQRFFRVRME